MRFLLVPYGNGCELLKQIELGSEDNASVTISLGRNDVTGLADVNLGTVKYLKAVSSNHVEVTVEGEQVTINAVARQDNIVHFNGSPCERGVKPMAIGDTISLVGKFSYFNYELRENTFGRPKKLRERQSSLPSAESSTAVAAPAEAAATPATSVIANLLRQYECPICYESLACAEGLNPCGCMFCFPCIKEWSQAHSQCPTCNVKFNMKASLQSKLVDNAVRDILKNEGDALASWEERVAEGIRQRADFRKK